MRTIRFALCGLMIASTLVACGRSQRPTIVEVSPTDTKQDLAEHLRRQLHFDERVTTPLGRITQVAPVASTGDIVVLGTFGNEQRRSREVYLSVTGEEQRSMLVGILYERRGGAAWREKAFRVVEGKEEERILEAAGWKPTE